MCKFRAARVQTSNVSIYIKSRERQEVINDLAGIIRGLANSIGGFKTNSGKTNNVFKEESPIKLEFKSVEDANSFKERITLYLSQEVHRKYLKVKRRFREKQIVK